MPQTRRRRRDAAPQTRARRKVAKRAETRAERNIKWIEHHLRVPEGRLVGQPVKVQAEQRRILAGIYDRPVSARRLRRAIISFGRKNGKTGLAAMLLLLHLCGPEAKPNSQLYSAAQSREQAGMTYNYAAKMVRMSPDLSTYVVAKESAKMLVCPELGTVYRALSAEVPTAYGLSPVFIIHDELGQVVGPRSELYDALETATGAHDEPLSIIISTQAPGDQHLLSLLIDDAIEQAKNAADTGIMPSTELFLWTAPIDADPWAESTWKLANPFYGTLLNPEVVRELAEDARRMPSKEAGFRNLVLNQRTTQTAALVSRLVWEACAGAPDRSALEAGPVFVGVDLSSRSDLTALAYIAQKERVWHAWVEFFAPGKGVDVRSRRDRVPYDLWAQQGLITLSEGATVDYAQPAERLIQLCSDYDVRAVAFDRWRMDVLEKELKNQGAEMKRAPEGPLVPHGQGYRDMSPAIDVFEAALLDGLILHGDNPVLKWCAANAVATMDPAGNRKVDKSKAKGRIDGIVALVMAFGATVSKVDEAPGPSVYEARGLLEV